jgi:DNA-binding Lrp family transcriptional regulator
MLDDKDWLILQALRQDSSATTRSVATKTGLPPTTVHHRIRRLKNTA